MKRLSFIPILFVFFFAACKSNAVTDPLEQKISVAAAKHDLSVLQDILTTAHPSLTLYKTAHQVDFLFDSIGRLYDDHTTMREFYNSLTYIINEVGCSHTELSLPDFAYDTLRNRNYFFPFPVSWIENKLLVNVTNKSLPEGTELVLINGMPAKKVLEQLSMYNSVDGFHRSGQLSLACRQFALQYYFHWGARKEFNLLVTDTTGKSRAVSVPAISYRDWSDQNEYEKYYFDGVDVDYDLSVDDDLQYALLRLRTFDFTGYQRQHAFENFCNNTFELLSHKKNIKTLVIDLRENTGGKLFDAALLFSYITKKPFSWLQEAYSKVDKVPYAEYLTPDFITHEKDDISTDLKDEFETHKNGLYYYADSLIRLWDPEPYHFTGDVFVITNATTVSAASLFASMTKYSGMGKVVGDETAGGEYSGNGFALLEYRLPESGFELVFPYAHMVYKFKDNKNAGRGLIPNYNVHDTREAFKNNEDIQLKYIVDSLILK